MKNFRTLTLAKKFYHQVSELKLRRDAKDQIMRAARSIALNLAEGSAKPTVRDRRRFFFISLGSLRECQTVLSLERLDSGEIWQLGDSLGAHLYRLIQKC